MIQVYRHAIVVREFAFTRRTRRLAAIVASSSSSPFLPRPSPRLHVVPLRDASHVIHVSASSQRLSRDARRPRRSSSVVRSRRIRQTFVSNRAFVCSSSASFVASRRVVRFVARARTTHFPAHVSRHTAHRDIAPRRDLPSRSPGHPSIHPSVRARREETCTWIRRVARAGVARSTAPRFNSRVVDIFFFKRDVDGGDATIAADASRARTRVDATAIDRVRRKNRDDVAVARARTTTRARSSAASRGYFSRASSSRVRARVVVRASVVRDRARIESSRGTSRRCR